MFQWWTNLALIRQVTVCLVTLVSFSFSSLMLGQSLAKNPYQIEYQFKAGFLTNFARLITWPDDISDRTTLNLCILDPKPFGGALSSIEGKLVLGKKLRVIVIQQPSEAANCQILFVNSDDKKIRRSFIEAVRGKPVIIVGEAPGFANSEGMINFILKNNKIRFEINRKRIERAGLRVSSRLLKYGIPVTDSEDAKL